MNNRIGCLGFLLVLAALNTPAIAEDTDIETINNKSIQERLAKINQILTDKKDTLNIESLDQSQLDNLLSIFGDFGDGILFSDFADAPIFYPFGDFGDDPFFGDFADW